MKFNPKHYQGKARLHRAIPGYPRISRLLAWNAEKGLYEPPARGKSYFARKKDYDLAGRPTRSRSYFVNLEEAVRWLNRNTVVVAGTAMSFADVVHEWREKKLPLKAETTKIHYEKMLRLYFQSLMAVPMVSFNASIVDQWLKRLKEPTSITMKSKRRISFDHELSLLSGILHFYRDYLDEQFIIPIFTRHHEDAETGRKRRRPRKDLGMQGFLQFRDQLRNLTHGNVLAALATIQYFQGLRISEAAAIHWEDLSLDLDDPASSRLSITRSVVWPRVKGSVSYLQDGFKNAKSNDGEKQHPLFPEPYFALLGLGGERKNGLVFQINGKHFEYRQIEYAYNTAFALAGLPYTGTHVMRHGGTRLVYNATKDLDVAKQLLGNRDLKTVGIYAQRDASALTDHAKKIWSGYENVAAIGCK